MQKLCLKSNLEQETNKVKIDLILKLFIDFLMEFLKFIERLLKSDGEVAV